MILDTSFLIDLIKGDKSVVGTKALLTEKRETCRVSAATIFELWTGITSSSRSQEEKVRVINAVAELPIVNVSRQIAEKAGEINGTLIKSGEQIDAMDTIIAASSLLENETLLTKNIKHFGRVKGLRIETY